MDRRLRLRSACLCLSLFAGVLSPALAVAQSLSGTRSLSFGSFTANAGGTVVVSPTGLRSNSGSVILVSQGGAASAGQFTVTGTANATFAITLPIDGTQLSDGVNTMTLSNFTSYPSGTGLLSGGGSELICIGATLTVGSGQLAGSYSGSISLTVNYN